MVQIAFPNQALSYCNAHDFDCVSDVYQTLLCTAVFAGGADGEQGADPCGHPVARAMARGTGRCL